MSTTSTLEVPDIVEDFDQLLGPDDLDELTSDLRAKIEQELADVDPLFWALSPRTAIDLGYMLYVIIEAKRSNPNALALLDDVQATKERLESEFARFEENPRAKMYITRLRTAAMSYARGLARANRVYDEAFAIANERKERAMNDCRWSAAGIGFLRAAGRMVTIAVAVGSAAMIILKLQSDVLASGKLSAGWTAVFTAASTLLLTMYFEMRKIQAALRETYIRFEHQKLKASIRRFRDVRLELARALRMVRTDYMHILGKRPPRTDPAIISLAALEYKHLEEDAAELREADRLLNLGPFEEIFGFPLFFWRERSDASKKTSLKQH